MYQTNLSWLLVTRRGSDPAAVAEAVALAEAAGQAVGWRDPEVLDTLAAAYAAAGRLADARRTAAAALEVARELERPGLAEEIAGRLERYREGRAQVDRAPPTY